MSNMIILVTNSSYSDAKEIILKQIEEKQIKTSKKDAACPIYENQKLCAQKVVTTFRDKEKILVLVYGKTQSGKTGCIL